MDKQKALTSALGGRDTEIAQYQLDIDNFRLALAKIEKEHSGASDMDVAMRQFGEHLQSLLNSSLIEQRKAQIIRDVIADQLQEME